MYRDAQEIHDAADELRVAAEAVMECLHIEVNQPDLRDEDDEEFISAEMPGLVAKVREQYTEFMGWVT